MHLQSDLGLSWKKKGVSLRCPTGTLPTLRGSWDHVAHVSSIFQAYHGMGGRRGLETTDLTNQN